VLAGAEADETSRFDRTSVALYMIIVWSGHCALRQMARPCRVRH